MNITGLRLVFQWLFYSVSCVWRSFFSSLRCWSVSTCSVCVCVREGDCLLESSEETDGGGSGYPCCALGCS